MPTFETPPRFEQDWKNLTAQQRAILRKGNPGSPRPGPTRPRPPLPGQAHIIWRRVETRAIYTPAPGPDPTTPRSPSVSGDSARFLEGIGSAPGDRLPPAVR